MSDKDDVLTMLGAIEAWYDGAINGYELWKVFGKMAEKHPEYITGIDPTKDEKGGENGG